MKAEQDLIDQLYTKDQLLSAQSREIEELKNNLEFEIGVANAQVEINKEQSEEIGILVDQITDLKAESERFKSELEKKNKITP